MSCCGDARVLVWWCRGVGIVVVVGCFKEERETEEEEERERERNSKKIIK